MIKTDQNRVLAWRLKVLRELGRRSGDAWLQRIAPNHWNHINQTGDCSLRQITRVEKRPLLALPTGFEYFGFPYRQTSLNA